MRLTRVKIEWTSDLGNRRAMGITVPHSASKKETEAAIQKAVSVLKESYEKRFGKQTDEEFNSKIIRETYVKGIPKQRAESETRGSSS